MNTLTTLASLTAASPLVLTQLLQTGSDPGNTAGDPHPVMLAWSDFDGDGRDDALAVTPAGGVQLLRGLGDGTLEDVTSSTGLAALHGVRFGAWGDFDGDGQVDLFLGTQSGPAHLLQNVGDHFVDVTAESGITMTGSHRRAHWVDYDADGHLDLHLVGGAENVLYHSLGDGLFESVELPVPHDAHVSVNAPVLAAPADSVDTITGATNRSSDQPSLLGEGAPAPAGSSTATSSGPNTGQSVPKSILSCVDSLIDDAGTGTCIDASTTPSLGRLYPLSEHLFVEDHTFNVGIGTTTPVSKLHVSATDLNYADTSHLVVEAGNPTISLYGSDGSTILMREPDGVGGLTDSWTIARDSNANGSALKFRYYPGSGATQQWMTVAADGNVGIGTTTPEAPLHIEDGALNMSTNGNTKLLVEGKNNSSAWIAVHSPGHREAGMLLGNPTDGEAGAIIYNGGTDWLELRSGGAGQFVMLNNGNVGLGTWAPTKRLDVNGEAIVDVLTIRGGADLVEGFDTTEGELEPGTVVVIDRENAGALTTSTEAYDFRVAGVVSGAGGVDAGLHLGQDGVLDGDTKVAMSGRVYVRCSAENGAIQPGDRLTTAALAGHAMKVTDTARSVGTVIGKAMSSLDEGTGLVLALVNLQ